MKILLCALLAVSTLSEEIEDLGTITPNRGITLDKATERSDFQRFKVTIDSLPPATNRTVLSITNSLLTIEEFSGVPSGRVLLRLQSVFLDGQISEPALFKASIWRGNPPKPTARPTALSDSKKTTNRAVTFVTSVGITAPSVRVYPPLPSGHSETYADKQDAVAEEMIRAYKKRGRRSE